MSVREVWKHNLVQESDVISTLLFSYPCIAIDTEFPGFLRFTTRNASEEIRYDDLKQNVDNLKIIQLGMTLFDEQGRRPSPVSSWLFNFCDFNPAVDAHAKPSIELLKKSGIDFDRNQLEGVDAGIMSIMLGSMIANAQRTGHNKWITFHALYDLGYLVKLLTRAPLPDKLSQFLGLVNTLLGPVYDTKYMARFCDGLHSGEISLLNMGKLLGVDYRESEHHNAGHDSMLTGTIFYALKTMIKVDKHVDMLYGTEQHCTEQKRARLPLLQQHPSPFTILPQQHLHPSTAYPRPPQLLSTAWPQQPSSTVYYMPVSVPPHLNARGYVHTSHQYQPSFTGPRQPLHPWMTYHVWW